MELAERPRPAAPRAPPLSCAEIGLLLGSYTRGERRLAVVGDPIYVGALVVFDLYERGLVDLRLCAAGRHVSLRDGDQRLFPLLETADIFDVARGLVAVPLAPEAPEQLPAAGRQMYGELQRMALLLGEPAPVCLHDFLVCCKTQLYLSMQLMECRAWLLLGLQEKGMLDIERRFLVLYHHTLTDEGAACCLYLSDAMNRVIGGQVHHPADFERYATPENRRGVYAVSQVLVHLGARRVRGCCNISKETRKRYIERQRNVGSNVGGMLRQPRLRLQPEDQEAWFVCMCVAAGLCVAEAEMSALATV